MMKVSHFKPVRRRELLRALGGAALALPALELFESEGRAQATGKQSKYVLFIYTPDGVNQTAFWPTGSSGRDFVLSETLAAFEPFRDKLLLLGPQMDGNRPLADTGLAYKSLPPQHQAAVTTAARIGAGCAGDPSCQHGGLPYRDQATAVNTIDGPSIDQVIANAVKGDSTFGSLNFGIHPVGGDTPSDINYRDDGTPLQRLTSPDEAWRYVFGESTGAMTADDSTELNKHTAVTDFLHQRFGALAPSLSVADRVRIDAHLTAMRSYEQRIEARIANQGETDALCTNPPRAEVDTDPDSIRTGADTETLSPFFMDVVSTAFGCNLTKVASISFGYPGGGDAGGLRMPWLGFTDPMHFVSHHANDATKLEKYRQMTAWIAGQLAGLMERLQALPSQTGVGTVLDETTIYWFNRHGDGDAHTNFGRPNLIMGGTGGYFDMGRWLQLPRTNPTQVLISLANAMGVEVDSFGQDLYGDTSPLAGLSA
jgi:Protein of unknown function (DUF1552)